MLWVKRVFLVSLVLVVLFIGAAAVLLATLDPNDYKPQIIEQVRKATGRELSLEGDLELTYFPWLGVRVGEAALSNASGFGSDPFASVRHVQVRVALLPLFQGEVKADTVTLEGLRVNLARDARGVANWDDLVEVAAEQDSAGAPEQTVEGTPLKLAVGGVVIEDATIHWQDAQSGTDLTISPIRIETGALEPGRPFDLSADIRLVSKSPEVMSDLALTARVTLDPLQERYALEELAIKVEAQGNSLPGGDLKANLEAAVVADMKAGTTLVNPLRVETMGLVLAGRADARGLGAEPKFAGELESEAFSPAALLEALGQTGLEPADPGVLRHAALSLSFEGDEKGLDVPALRVELDDSTLEGKASVRDFARPAIRFELALDEMDLDRYLPAPAGEEDAGGKSPGAGQQGVPDAGDDRLDLPMEMLRDLDVDGRILIGKLKAANLRLSDIVAVIKAKDGVVALSPLKSVLYRGTLDSGLKVDARKDVPAFRVSSRLSGVQIGELLADVAQQQAHLRGTTRVSLDLRTRGDAVSTLKKQLGGKMSLAVTKGALRDRELARNVEIAIAFLQNREPRPVGEELIFETLTASAVVRSGVMDNRDFRLVTPVLLARGEGTVNLPADSVDYVLSVALAGGAPEEQRVFVPITVKGPYEKLAYGVDLGAIARDRLKREADRAVRENLPKVVPEELSAPLEQGLKKFFGR